MGYSKHLYAILHPNHSLIASQLEPEDFIKHYVDSARYFEGRLLFVELDPDFRSSYFDIEKAYSQLIPHEDGSPKATKFIGSYRVVENLDFDALGTLYFCDAKGDYIALKPAASMPVEEPEEMRLILEINPVNFMVLTKYNLSDFSNYITDPRNGKGAPKVLYGQAFFNADDFLRNFSENPYLMNFVPGIHPSRLRDAIMEMRTIPGKNVKGIALNCPFDQYSYKQLKGGFTFASQGKTKFYPLMPIDYVKQNYYKFYKEM